MSAFADNVRAIMESFGVGFDEAADYVVAFEEAYGDEPDEDGDILVDHD